MNDQKLIRGPLLLPFTIGELGPYGGRDTYDQTATFVRDDDVLVLTKSPLPESGWDTLIFPINALLEALKEVGAID